MRRLELLTGGDRTDERHRGAELEDRRKDREQSDGCEEHPAPLGPRPRPTRMTRKNPRTAPRAAVTRLSTPPRATAWSPSLDRSSSSTGGAFTSDSSPETVGEREDPRCEARPDADEQGQVSASLEGSDPEGSRCPSPGAPSIPRRCVVEGELPVHPSQATTVVRELGEPAEQVEVGGDQRTPTLREPWRTRASRSEPEGSRTTEIGPSLVARSSHS